MVKMDKGFVPYDDAINKELEAMYLAGNDDEAMNRFVETTRLDPTSNIERVYKISPFGNGDIAAHEYCTDSDTWRMVRRVRQRSPAKAKAGATAAAARAEAKAGAAAAASGDMAWECETARGWVPYSPATSRQLEAALLSGNERAVVQWTREVPGTGEQILYVLHPASRTQMKTINTNSTRRMRRVPAAAAPAAAAAVVPEAPKVVWEKKVVDSFSKIEWKEIEGLEGKMSARIEQAFEQKKTHFDFKVKQERLR
jgi:hypothetical protein